MRLPMQPWFIVCLRDAPSNSDDYLGPFRTYEAAKRVRDRLNRDIEAHGVRDWEARVEEMRPASDEEEFRDVVLRRLAAEGYKPIPVAQRRGPAFL